MLAKIVLGALAATALAFHAPPALAGEPTFDCGFDAVRDATQVRYDGAAYGYVVHPQGGGVSIRCVLFVNGVEATSTPLASGEAAAVSAGQISFEAGPEDVVYLCPEVTWHESPDPQLFCWDTDPPQLPPQVVIDALDAVLDAVTPIWYPVDAAVCPVLAAAGASGAGVPGVVEVDDTGDVFLLGELFWDCPPYVQFPPT